MTLTPDNLEQALADLTASRPGDPLLVHRALEHESAAPRRRSPIYHLLESFRHRLILQIAAALLVCVLLVGLFLPAVGRARHAQSSVQALRAVPGDDLTLEGLRQLPPAGEEWKPIGTRPDTFGLGSGYVAMGPAHLRAESEPLARANLLQPKPDSDAPRSVIRKATLELITPDVRAAFAKASHLVSDAQGEYVQDSALTGTGNTTQAQLTLRIAVPRLPAVLDELRQLGLVRNEQSGGDDVTAQVVDLEARIRNEQRVELELLQLLEKRADAPLKDLLELRAALSDVRQSIERLTGQRQHLGRLIDLATVLVLIRPTDEPPKPAAAPSGLSAYFSKAISASWRSGLEFLADTLANLVSLLIGGLIWWLLAALIVYAALRYKRATLARGV